MQWLLDQSEALRAAIRQGPFFASLSDVRTPTDLGWTHQLLHQSREFTQALCLRYSLCQDKRYQGIFAEHAVEEADHPDQLITWMVKHGFLASADADLDPATPETINSLALCTRAALREPPDVQVVVLNVLSEGVALDFYTAVMPVLQRLDIQTGRYWKVHKEVDAHHLQMGLDLCGDVEPTSAQGRRYTLVLHHAASLYHQMLSSWVGVRVPMVDPCILPHGSLSSFTGRGSIVQASPSQA